jgi:serine/threonine-protein kinase
MTFGDGGNRLTMHLPGDPGWLVKDDYIRPRLTMTDFRGDMRVDYLDRQGNVQHLYPQLGDANAHTAGDPPRVFQPGETISLGEPGPNNPGWQVDQPFGTDVIIAIASEDALFDRPRPANVEKAAVYLRDLKRAVELARARGARIAATAMPVETRLK